MKLYHVTEIDRKQNDKVSRYFITCKSRRDERLKAENIVQVTEIKPDIEFISSELDKTEISEEMKNHLIKCLFA